MNVVYVVEQRAFLEEINDCCESNYMVDVISNFIIDSLNDLFLFDFE